jgi:hypothetical protein
MPQPPATRGRRGYILLLQIPILNLGLFRLPCFSAGGAEGGGGLYKHYAGNIEPLRQSADLPKIQFTLNVYCFLQILGKLTYGLRYVSFFRFLRYIRKRCSQSRVVCEHWVRRSSQTFDPPWQICFVLVGAGSPRPVIAATKISGARIPFHGTRPRPYT